MLKLPLLLYLSRSVNAPLHSPEILQYLAGIKLVLIPYKRLLKSANNICTNINAIDKPTTKSKRKTSTEPFFVTRLVKVFVNINRAASVGQPGANWIVAGRCKRTTKPSRPDFIYSVVARNTPGGVGCSCNPLIFVALNRIPAALATTSGPFISVRCHTLRFGKVYVQKILGIGGGNGGGRGRSILYLPDGISKGTRTSKLAG